MMIGKPGPALTGICTADAKSIEIRGRDLCNDLMGRLSFTEFFFLLVTGKEPSVEQRYFLDLLLIAIAEHGLTPTAQAARMTLDAAPDSLQGAVAAGILGCGTVVAEIWGKPPPLNVAGPIAAVLLDLDFPAAVIKAIPLLARTVGLPGHLAEEQTRPIGFLMSYHADQAIAYDGAS
jgi:citrate synthase